MITVRGKQKSFRTIPGSHPHDFKQVSSSFCSIPGSQIHLEMHVSPRFFFIWTTFFVAFNVTRFGSKERNRSPNSNLHFDVAYIICIFVIDMCCRSLPVLSSDLSPLNQREWCNVWGTLFLERRSVDMFGLWKKVPSAEHVCVTADFLTYNAWSSLNLSWNSLCLQWTDKHIVLKRFCCTSICFCHDNNNTMSDKRTKKFYSFVFVFIKTFVILLWKTLVRFIFLRKHYPAKHFHRFCNTSICFCHHSYTSDKKTQKRFVHLFLI